MVIYKLGIFNGKNSKEIFNKGSKNSLREIDDFTSSFSDENSLKQYLLDNNFMNIEDVNKKLRIIYKYNGNINELPVIYQKEKEYLNYAFIRYKLSALVNNKEFLNKLINHYQYNNLQFDNVENLKLYLSSLNKSGNNISYYDRTLIEHTLDDLVRIATYKYDSKNNMTKYNHRGTRDLGMLIYKFEEKEKLKQFKQEIILSEDELKEELARKNKKWILSSDGDPDFPPNSEELKQYLEAEEKLIAEIEANQKTKR